MKFFIDTANVDEIRQAYSMGVLDGVTTNPSLMAKEKGKGTFKEILKEICSIVKGPVSAEVVSMDAEGMFDEGKELAKIADNIVIKVPITLEGLKAMKKFQAKCINTNCTLIFSPMQALLAAKAGATYVSPFIGRLDDISTEGMQLVDDIVSIYANYDIATEIIVASIRHPMHVVEAALLGADIATIPFNVISKLVKHPLTDIGIKRFLDDWEKVQK